jgi:hypothetical protein
VAVAVSVDVITGAARRVRTRVAVPVPAALVAKRVTLKEPTAAFEVPDIRPVVASIERPLGRPVALKEVGEFSEVIW